MIFWPQDPRKATCSQYWDLVTSVALIYTAAVTPFEVAFLAQLSPSERWSDTVFLLNRCVDIIFIMDMLMQFRTAFLRIDLIKGASWITDPGAIAFHYVRSTWFYIDLFSILTSLFDIVGGEGLDNFIALRLIRVLRLAKLIRLARGSRIFRKWEMSWSINYALLALVKIVLAQIVGVHWFACIWGLEASFDPLHSWPRQNGYCVAWEDNNRSAVEAAVDACSSTPDTQGVIASGRMCDKGECIGGRCEGGYECVAPFTMYSNCLYFSAMTLTSVGYGDILAEPFNVTEQLVACFIMLTAGALWGYLIGTFCNLAAEASPQEKIFKGELTSLNSFMSKNHIRPELQFRLREYLFEKRSVNDSEVRKRLLSRLSPSMKLEVVWAIHARWVHMVWYLSDMNAVPGRLIIDLGMCLNALIFPPRELCPPEFLYIIQSGKAFWGGKMKGLSDVWGDDVVLPRHLQLQLPALCVTYLSVLTIESTALLHEIDKHPEFKAHFRVSKIKWMIRRAFLREAETRAFAQGNQFRGRFRPVYAKELADMIDAQARRQMEALEANTPVRPDCL